MTTRIAAPVGPPVMLPELLTAGETAYCVACGHDQAPNHRGGRCWTDELGDPVTRSRRQIACDCRNFIADQS